MAVQSTERRLAAILAADMVGYSRLMEADEDGTLARQKLLRRELIDSTIREHRGRIVKSTGDGLLVEFPSVVDAVRCAVKIQSAVREREAPIAEADRISYRMGINVGDIVIDGDDIFGAGVNIAARLEGVAEPGGICISRAVFDHIKGKVDSPFDDLGDWQLKNIATPVRVFALRTAPESDAGWHRVAARADALSIAVLPFDNFSGSADLEPFAAGLTEDLIASLSKVPGLSVVARNSSEAFKGRKADIRQVASALNVRYLLEGSVQGSGKRLRITSQLIDGANGSHLWSERYDREVGDVFALQDDIVKKVLVELQVKLTVGEQARVASRGTNNLEAWLLCVRGRGELMRFTRESNLGARDLFQAAHEADPRWCLPLAGLAFTFREAALRGWGPSRDDDIRRAVALAERAIEHGPDNPIGYSQLAASYILTGRVAEGARLAEKALELAPNDGRILGNAAMDLLRVGQVDRALTLYARLRKVSPIPNPADLANEAFAFHMTGKHERAVRILNECLERSAFTDARIRLAAIDADLGHIDKARMEIARVLDSNPDATVEEFTGNLPFSDPQRAQWYAGLLKSAGLPER